MSYVPDASAESFKRIGDAASYIFDQRAVLGVGRFTLATGEVEVVLGGETSMEPGANAAFLVGLARHESGLVVYEHHVKRWRDTDDSLALASVGQMGAPMPVSRHGASCVPNLGGHDCIRIDADLAAKTVDLPKYAFGSDEPYDRRELPESGRVGVARMVERFATDEYADLLVGAQVQEALAVMGGADTVFKDPGMRAFAGAIALH